MCTHLIPFHVEHFTLTERRTLNLYEMMIKANSWLLSDLEKKAEIYEALQVSD
jgi:hypothetical protein